ncbi:BTB/POZ and MATH domain-containing protein 2 [Rhynchospora pubera]|uniref:BTB/POZ and MATH domain-containing protein 2 n=1 Tax=Rhynchospora pubera TaxID=906938 RepID=A0AAV8HEZ3_9POAL|nr:BTB/POZ and MATH domain-containing protein 2 [Rhynchospora pubera]
MMTSTSELAIGSHIFKITGYSVLTEVDVGKYVSSSTFTVGGHEFYIDMYPQGNEENNEDFISIYLVLNSDDKELPVQFDFGLVDMSGDSFVLGEKTSLSCSFAFKNQYWGFGRFIKRADLEESRYLKDDCFMVRCTVRVVKAIREEAVQASVQSVVPPSDLHLHLAKLLESGEMANVTFEVDQESFSAHRIVLAARSPVFKQLLSQNGESEMRSCVQIEDAKAPVFKALLHYVYTDQLPNDGDEDDEGHADKALTSFDQELLVAADAYELERLKFICEENLRKKISVDTVASTLELAEKCNCDRLKAACLEFAAKPENLIALMQTHAKISEGSEQQNTVGLSSLPDLLNKLSHVFVNKKT